MKKLFLILISTFCITTIQAQSSGLDGLLDKLKSGSNGPESGSSTMNTIGSMLGNLISTDKLEISDMQGEWSYVNPAVKLKGDNALENVGGAAASSTVEAKLATYYSKLGINQMKMTVNADSTFTMTLKKMTLKGTISKGEDGFFIFKFNSFGKISIGKINTYVNKSGNNLSVMFDATKLISIVKKVSDLSKNSTIKTASDLLSKYEGIYIGVKLKK